MTETGALRRARWWMRRRWCPRTFAEYMATPAKIEQRDRMLAACDEFLTRGRAFRAEPVERTLEAGSEPPSR